MKKIVDLINRHKILTICIALLLFVAQPIAVHLMFKTPAATPFWESSWGAGDLLGYVAGFEAFIGTVYLGTVAVKQNQRNIDINDRLLKIEEASSTFLRYPNYKISNCMIEQTSLREIEDLNTIMFYRNGLDRNQICALENLDQQFHRLSFNFENVSDYNFSISLRKLVLTSLDDQVTRIEYNTIALASIDENFNIPARQNLQIGFIIFNTDLEGYPGYLVEMEFLLRNILNEVFVLSLEYVLYIHDHAHIFKILKENISTFRNVN